MDRVRAHLHADEIHRAGITGKNVTVCSVDSGAAAAHPDFTGRLIGFADFVNGRPKCYDDASHGTHVLGIIGGDGRSMGGRYRGIAPECRLLPVKVLDQRGEGEMANILSAIDWILENRDRYEIRVLNISAGGTRGELDAGAGFLVKKVEEAWDAGLVVIVAAGNMGPDPMSVTVPGNSRKVITVGSSDIFLHRAMRSRSYSGCGPTLECVCKPELVAPGTNVVSCAASWSPGHYYSIKSGTSMAAPAIAGAVALLLESEPFLNNIAVKMRLREAAVDLGYPKNRQGWGIPDLRKLIRR
ncbi:MAG: S8 family peptidase [Lachnospiraceae bacterium]|nr:S8 family peptidase [Lachnospiraceae bacterium]